jgi:hypothetical protein
MTFNDALEHSFHDAESARSGELRLADQSLQREFDERPDEVQCASMLLGRAARELDEQHTELDQCNVTHICYLKPRTAEEQA